MGAIIALRRDRLLRLGIQEIGFATATGRISNLSARRNGATRCRQSIFRDMQVEEVDRQNGPLRRQTSSLRAAKPMRLHPDAANLQ